ncbi:MAG: SDR family oxidoreductase [Bacteroidota bacterium]
MSYNLLEGKKGIIFGALDHSSIAWKVAEKASEEGASIMLTNAPVALRMGKIKELGEKTNSQVIAADATSIEDLTKLFDAAQEEFGKLDFVLHSIGMSPNVRKKRTYTDLNYDWLQKTFDISAVSFHKICQLLYKREQMSEWGSILALSYIAAQRTFSEYNDMAEAKALLESIARSFGYHFGKKSQVRVNTISQSPTPTTAGSGVEGFNKMYQYGTKMSPLGNATAEECANYCIMMFSDYTRKVTMQNLFHDGGFSSVGITTDLLEDLPE